MNKQDISKIINAAVASLLDDKTSDAVELATIAVENTVDVDTMRAEVDKARSAFVDSDGTLNAARASLFQAGLVEALTGCGAGVVDRGT